MKIPKKGQNLYKSTKPIPIWIDWYPKNNPNLSKFRNLNIGEITNQTIKGKLEKTAVFGAWVSAPMARRSSVDQTQRRGGVGTGLCFLQVRASSEQNVFGDFGFVWATILCDKVYWGLNVYLMWQLLIGGVNSPFSANSGQNVFLLINGSSSMCSKNFTSSPIKL